ncbi:hypothetical protein J3Q64DRAFT_1739501 [Phycomyces blakesleeanus]|uniref:Uncharacterized protein n=1 Tax=Phycomyces blakesleeanus TaxID=4837 RepID=A0ABR3B159_PHYBL
MIALKQYRYKVLYRYIVFFSKLCTCQTVLLMYDIVYKKDKTFFFSFLKVTVITRFNSSRVIVRSIDFWIDCVFGVTVADRSTSVQVGGYPGNGFEKYEGYDDIVEWSFCREHPFSLYIYMSVCLSVCLESLIYKKNFPLGAFVCPTIRHLK